ncbi:hypothetical protein [Vibrio cyclitrophicus]|uniref:hypothetical protein n=1 Tax=Vibrio cyclitrophicus TaxID=47951 RepID=UPI0002FB9D68|nr:hypothetical protein [Vibrio cyclitrophicus]OEF26799.1 hypothetical protein OA9_15170 [Vibrio cyclitrophicus 1F97]
MDTSGFLTLIAVILTGFSLLSRGKKVTYIHRFGVPHIIVFFIGLVTVLGCLFYDMLAVHGLLLPYNFIVGFDENDLLLVTSIIMLCIFMFTVLHGVTLEHRLESLCRSIDGLLTSNALGDLVYVLNENIDLLEDDSCRSQGNKDITALTMIRLLLSKRFTDYLSDMDYQLYLRLLKLDPSNEVSLRKFNDFLYEQLTNSKSSLMWEVALLRDAYSPRVPNMQTPLLKCLYDESNENLKYSLYEQIGNCFEKLMCDEYSLAELRKPPSNVMTDDVIKNSLAGLYIFLLFNLIEDDLRKGRIIRADGEVRTPYILNKKVLYPLVKNKDSIQEKVEQEFQSRIDFFIYDSLLSFGKLFQLDEIVKIKSNSLIDLVECVAYAHFYIRSSNKFEESLLKYLLIGCIEIYATLKHLNPELSIIFAQLCTRPYQGAGRSFDLSTKDFEILKHAEAKNFIEHAM